MPEEEINKKLSLAQGNILFIDNQIDSDNYRSPVNAFLNNKLLPISTTLYKTYDLEFTDLTYRSDDNLRLFGSYDEINSFKLTEVSENVDLRGENNSVKGAFNQINFLMAVQKRVITRLYEKVTCSFARIGGFMYNIILIAKLLLYFWSENNTLMYLISAIIPDAEKNPSFEELRKKKIVNIRISKPRINNNDIEHNEKKPESVIENGVNMSNDNFIKLSNMNNHRNEAERNENVIPNYNNIAAQKIDSRLKINNSK